MSDDTRTHSERPLHRVPRRLTITVAVVGALIGLVVTNAVVVGRQTARAAGASVMRVAGEDVNVRQDGPATGPVLVLIHGFGGSLRWWDPVVPALARSYRVIRIDLLGFGRSAKPSGDKYTIQAEGRLVAAVLDRLDVTRVVVVGHSSGGSVATSLAEQRSDLVAGIVLVSAGPRTSAFISQGALGNVLFAPGLGQLLWRVRTDGLLRRSMATGFSRTGFEIPQDLVDDARATTFHAFTAFGAGADDYLDERSLPDRLTGLGKPLLVIFGEKDRRWHSSSAEDYKKVPGARVTLLPGIGHSPMQEDPSQTTQLIETFVSSIGR